MSSVSADLSRFCLPKDVMPQSHCFSAASGRPLWNEKEEVVTICGHLKSLRFSHVPIYAFTEQGEVAKFNRKYKGLAVTCSDDFHDRFLIIDNEELHGPGSSINSLGRRITSYSTRDPKDIAKLPALVP